MALDSEILISELTSALAASQDVDIAEYTTTADDGSTAIDTDGYSSAIYEKLANGLAGAIYRFVKSAEVSLTGVKLSGAKIDGTVLVMTTKYETPGGGKYYLSLPDMSDVDDDLFIDEDGNDGALGSFQGAPSVSGDITVEGGSLK
jgi:hypothetical protein|tara:strand:+ start:37 stop:474 length:438 start_codon:yes stop_codon:yes gene_type:complete